MLKVCKAICCLQAHVWDMTLTKQRGFIVMLEWAVAPKSPVCTAKCDRRQSPPCLNVLCVTHDHVLVLRYVHSVGPVWWQHCKPRPQALSKEQFGQDRNPRAILWVHRRLPASPDFSSSVDTLNGKSQMYAGMTPASRACRGWTAWP